jgi:hypothetical protein
MRPLRCAASQSLFPLSRVPFARGGKVRRARCVGVGAWHAGCAGGRAADACRRIAGAQDLESVVARMGRSLRSDRRNRDGRERLSAATRTDLAGRVCAGGDIRRVSRLHSWQRRALWHTCRGLRAGAGAQRQRGRWRSKSEEACCDCRAAARSDYAAGQDN